MTNKNRKNIILEILDELDSMVDGQPFPYIDFGSIFPSTYTNVKTSGSQGFCFDNSAVNYHTKHNKGKRETTVYLPELDQSSLTIVTSAKHILVSFKNGSIESTLKLPKKGIDVKTVKANFKDPILTITADLLGDNESEDSLIEVTGLNTNKK